MADWLPLAEVAARPGLAARPVARRAGALLTRERFLADVRGWRAAFAACPGRRVALYFDDGYDFAAALYGAWHADKLVHLPGDAQPETLRHLLPSVDACAGDLPCALQPRAAADAAPLSALAPPATALIVYTSGSGGAPAAIHKRLDQLDAELQALQAEFGARLDVAPDGSPSPASIYATVAHQHIYGLLFCTLWPLAAGRPFVVGRLSYPEEMAQRLAAGASVLVSSPAHLKRLNERLDWRAAAASLRAVFSSGGPLPAEAAQRCAELLGTSPIEVYGSSETGGVAWRRRAAQGERWQPLPGVQWRIDDGRLALRSAHLPDARWWRSEDRAQALPEGQGGGFLLLGRADRIVKIEEKRVSLAALEAALAACPEIDEARALLLDAAGAAPRLAVVAVPSTAGRALLAQQGKQALNLRLRAALLERVERVALPRRWRYVPALPVNAQGKSTEALLAALFRPARPAAQWLRREPASAQLQLDVDAGLAVFDGHFPGRPLLPGVAQLDWAVQFARECFALPVPAFRRIEALKFRQPVAPGTRLTLDLDWTPASGVLAFRYLSAAGLHADGRLVFGAGP